MTVFTECVLGQTFRNLTGEVSIPSETWHSLYTERVHTIICTLLIIHLHIWSVTAVHDSNGKTKQGK